MFMQRMKRLLAVLLACALLCSLVPAGLAATYPCAGYVKVASTLRRTASESGSAVCALPVGDAVYVTGESGSYYIVEYDGNAGFVPKANVSLEGETQQNLPDSEYAARYAALYQGQEGEQVRSLQRALIELGFLSDEADGKYGKKTAEAVAAFQEKNSLNNSGSADAQTQGLLFEGKPLNSRGKAKSVTVVPSVEGFPVSSGKTGDLVSRVQIALKALGYYTGKVDGKCGTSTVKAIKRFQTKHGLKSTGVADAEMQTILFGTDAIAANATPTPKPTNTPVPPVIGWENGQTQAKPTFPLLTNTTDSVNLRKGPSTSSARILSIPAGGEVSVEAVQGDFLKVSYTRNKKTYNGYVMAQYVDVPAIYLGGEELKEDETAQQLYGSLTQGASGTRVSVLQEALTELGFYTGSVSGNYNAETVAAVKAFQRKNGLLQTGNASAELQKLIYEGKPLNSRGKKTSVAVLPPIDGVNMRQGDRGYQVTQLQEALRELGYYTAAINGTFDVNTAKAVKKFQKEKKLTVDGIVGSKTLFALNIASATPTPVLNMVTSTPAPITADNVIIIHSGTRGLVVTRLQERLVALGYYNITPDGIYNANDIAAVRAFQQKNGLKADGVAGLETQLLLYGESALPSWATPAPTPSPTPKPEATVKPNTNVTLQMGSRGDNVTLLQARLTVLEYFHDVIDGRYGTKTASAVAAFQQNNNLTADGVAGPKTLTRIYGASAKPAPEETKPTATPKPGSTTVRIGDTGEQVKTVQRMLLTLGYLTGAADGIFGPKTNLAVKAFQRANRLKTDGIVGEKTFLRLQTLAGEKDQAPEEKPGSTGSSGGSGGSGVTGTDFKAPTAAEVRFANWYSEIRPLARSMPKAIVYDYMTGLYYNVNMFSFGKHCDAEPITASDTAIMRQIMGTENWTAHAVWIILSDGKVYMASTHSKGHEVDHNPNNDLTGHICIHFPREMSEAEETGVYAVSHQKEILSGWEITQSMIR